MTVKVEARHPLYQAALDADEAFERALVEAYGKRGVSEARYWRIHLHAGVKEAKAAKVRADLAWHKAMTLPECGVCGKPYNLQINANACSVECFEIGAAREEEQGS